MADRNSSEITTLFHSEPAAAHGWRSLFTSLAIHLAAAAVILAIPVSVAISTQHIRTITMLSAPPLQPWHAPPVRTRMVLPRRFIAPAVIQRPPEVHPPVTHVPAAPLIAVQKPVILPAVSPPAPKIAPPAPQLRTGMFEARAARPPEAAPPRQMKTGIFGGPMGVKPVAASNTALPLPRTGAFDASGGNSRQGGASPSRALVADAGFGAANATGQAPAGRQGSLHSAGFGDGADSGGTAASGAGHGGAIRNAGFGDGDSGQASSGAGRGGAVRSSGFGDVAAGAAPTAGPRERAAVTATPVQILYKPKPVYTAEARALKIEGEVLLEVVFRASGTVEVQRVVRGLGSGLNDAAQHAALGIRFRPATRGGIAVDTKATVNITFELT